jgi:hypothetical protein
MALSKNDRPAVLGRRDIEADRLKAFKVTHANLLAKGRQVDADALAERFGVKATGKPARRGKAPENAAAKPAPETAEG